MGKKRHRRPSPAEVTEAVVDEIDRRLESVMAHNAAAFSEGVQRYYDGKWAALKELRDWLAAQ